MEIKYTKENIDLFKEFTKPTTIDDYDICNKWFETYKNDIRKFFKEQLNINITLYRHNYIWFYLIETEDEFYHSDDCDSLDLIDYNMALNRAIKYIFNNILNFTLN